MTKDKKKDILQKNISFKSEHYEVGKLWTDSNIHLKNSKELAVQRLESLEKRSMKNHYKAKQYSDSIRALSRARTR